MGKPVHIAWLLICAAAAAHGQSYEEALAKMQSREQALRTYTCLFTSFARGPEKSEEVVYTYFFKKPSSVRMETRSGKYEGTVLLYTGGDVRVRPGHGIFSWFTFSFEPTHKYIVDPRGNGVHQSTWRWYIDQHILLLPLTRSRQMGVDTVNERRALMYELTSEDPEKSRSVATERVWIDAQDFVLLRYEQYDRDGVLLQSGSYHDIVLDSELNDTLFTEISR